MQLNDAKTREQHIVLKKWNDQGCVGSYLGTTGVGKLRIGIIAACEFIRRNPSEKSIFIVPTENLRDNEVERGFDLWGYTKEKPRVTVECIQSAYKRTGEHYNTIVIDEVHMVMGESYKQFLENNTYDRLLCLTATPPEDKAKLDWLVSKAPICWVTTRERALKLGLISPLITYNLAIPLTPDEQNLYNTINRSYSFYENLLGGRFLAFSQSSRYLRFKQIGKNGESVALYTPENRVIYKSEIDNISIPKEYCRDLTPQEVAKFREKVGWATLYWKYMTDRKKLCYNAANKIDYVKQIVDMFPTKKGLIFSESVDAADKIQMILGDQCVKFHSKLKDADRKLYLDQFSNGDKRIISAVKALNAGLDVPECDFAICHSGSSKQQDNTQRMGRISRFVEGKMGLYINFYCDGTKEMDWVTKRTSKQEVHWITNIDQIVI